MCVFSFCIEPSIDPMLRVVQVSNHDQKSCKNTIELRNGSCTNWRFRSAHGSSLPVKSLGNYLEGRVWRKGRIADAETALPRMDDKC
jgi:hypothetical protein